jgi:hypothetical protein
MSFLERNRSMNKIKLVKTLLVLSIISLVSACASYSVKPEQAKNIHRIGVISFLENDFRIYDFGLTIFERRDHKKLDLPGWRLESLVQNTVKEELDNHSSYKYVPISKGKAIKKRIQETVSDSIVEGVKQSSLSIPNPKEFASELKLLGEKNKIDTWILVYPARGRSPIVPRELFITGVGAIRELMIGGHYAAIFAEFRVSIVTANNAEVIAELTTSKGEDISVSLWEKANALPGTSAPNSFVKSVKGLVSSELRDLLTEMKVTSAHSEV